MKKQEWWRGRNSLRGGWKEGRGGGWAPAKKRSSRQLKLLTLTDGRWIEINTRPRGRRDGREERRDGGINRKREVEEEKEGEREGESGRTWHTERWDLHYAMRTDEGITHTHTQQTHIYKHTRTTNVLLFARPRTQNTQRHRCRLIQGGLPKLHKWQKISLTNDRALSLICRPLNGARTAPQGEGRGEMEMERDREMEESYWPWFLWADRLLSHSRCEEPCLHSRWTGKWWRWATWLPESYWLHPGHRDTWEEMMMREDEVSQ